MTPIEDKKDEKVSFIFNGYLFISKIWKSEKVKVKLKLSLITLNLPLEMANAWLVFLKFVIFTKLPSCQVVCAPDYEASSCRFESCREEMLV